MTLAIKEFNDKLMFNDEHPLSGNRTHGMWAKTEIIAGYGDYHPNPTGKSSLDEVIFTGESYGLVYSDIFNRFQCFASYEGIEIPEAQGKEVVSTGVVFN